MANIILPIFPIVLREFTLEEGTPWQDQSYNTFSNESTLLRINIIHDILIHCIIRRH